MLSFEEDPEPFGKERDSAIQALAREAGVDVIIKTSHTLYPLQQYVSSCSMDHSSLRVFLKKLHPNPVVRGLRGPRGLFQVKHFKLEVERFKLN